MAGDAGVARALSPAGPPGRPGEELGRLRGRAVGLLLVLSSGIPEFLTGSTPITRLVLDPLGFLVSVGFLLALYGAGALLIREAAVRLRKGWASILSWGVAYGILEEGVAVHTFFQTHGPPVGLLGSYGHYLGVNWVWAVGLAAFHSLFSIALPILLTELWFPEVRGLPLLRPRGIAVALVAYVADVLLFALTTPNSPGPGLYAASLAVVGVCVAIGLGLSPGALTGPPGVRRASLRTFLLLGLVPFTAWVLIGYLLSALDLVPAIVTVGLFLAVEAATLGAVVRWAGTVDRERTALWFAWGLLVPLFVWDAVLDFGAVPGILAVAALAAAFLWRLGRRIARRRPVVVPAGALLGTLP